VTLVNDARDACEWSVTEAGTEARAAGMPGRPLPSRCIIGRAFVTVLRNQPAPRLEVARRETGSLRAQAFRATVRGWFRPITRTQIVPMVATAAIGIRAMGKLPVSSLM